MTEIRSSLKKKMDGVKRKPESCVCVRVCARANLYAGPDQPLRHVRHVPRGPGCQGAREIVPLHLNRNLFSNNINKITKIFQTSDFSNFRFLTTLSYVYSNGIHIIFSQTQWCMRSDTKRAMNFSCMYVEHCMTSHLKDCKVPKAQLEAEGLLSNMKQLEFGML